MADFTKIVGSAYAITEDMLHYGNPLPGEFLTGLDTGLMIKKTADGKLRDIGGGEIDTRANRPLAGISGRRFYAIDQGTMYIDNGSEWTTRGSVPTADAEINDPEVEETNNFCFLTVKLNGMAYYVQATPKDEEPDQNRKPADDSHLSEWENKTFGITKLEVNKEISRGWTVGNIVRHYCNPIPGTYQAAICKEPPGCGPDYDDSWDPSTSGGYYIGRTPWGGTTPNPYSTYSYVSQGCNAGQNAPCGSCNGYVTWDWFEAAGVPSRYYAKMEWKGCQESTEITEICACWQGEIPLGPEDVCWTQYNSRPGEWRQIDMYQWEWFEYPLCSDHNEMPYTASCVKDTWYSTPCWTPEE